MLETMRHDVGFDVPVMHVLGGLWARLHTGSFFALRDATLVSSFEIAS